MKVDCIEVGQIWENDDPRLKGQLKEVVAVYPSQVLGVLARLEDVRTGRSSMIRVDKFLSRQGTQRGYTLKVHRYKD